MAQSHRKEREGLSLQTLVIAALASGVAAVATSHFWKAGTVVAAAMTPVIVSVVKEALERPIKSDVVRRSATSARSLVAGTAATRTEGARTRSPAVGTIPTPPQNGLNGGNAEITQGDVLLSHPRRTYGGGGARRRSLRGRPLKLAIVTGLLAFAVALVVITVPELVFGGAVSSGHRTTFFGGGSSSSSKSKTSDQKTTTQPQSQPSQTTPQTTTPQTTTPQQTPSQPQAQPQQPSPSGGASPAPQQPSQPSTPLP